MSGDSFATGVVRICAAKICQNMGFSTAQNSSLDVLADVTRLYIERLCKDLHEQSEQSGRTVPILDDLGQAFSKQQISVTELGEYMRQVAPDTLPVKIPLFPVKGHKQKPLFGPVSDRELAMRQDYIPSYFPPQHPEWLPDSKTKSSEQKESRTESESKKKEQPENGDGTPAKLSTTARRSTMSEVRRKTKPTANDELPDYGEHTALMLGLVKEKPPPSKAPKQPPASVAPSLSVTAADGGKESRLDRTPLPKIREMAVKRSPSPKTPERAMEVSSGNEPKIVIKLGMIPQPTAKPQKEVHVKESKKEKKQLDRSIDLEPGEIASSLDSSIDECITAVIGENIRLTSPTPSAPFTPTPPAPTFEPKPPAVLKPEPPPSVEEPASINLAELQIKLKKNREQGKTIEGIRKKLEKKRAAEEEKSAQAKVISDIVSKNFAPIVSKKTHSKTKQLPSTSQLPSLPPLSLRVPSSKPSDTPSSKTSEQQPSSTKKVDIPKPAVTVKLFAPDPLPASAKLAKSPLKLHKEDSSKQKLSVSPLKIHVHKPHKEKKREKESHGKDAPFPKLTLSIDKKKVPHISSSSSSEKPSQPIAPSVSASPAPAAVAAAPAVSEKVPPISFPKMRLPSHQPPAAVDQPSKQPSEHIQDEMKKKKKQKRDKEKHHHHHHRKDKERHQEKERHKEEKKEKQHDTTPSQPPESTLAHQAPQKSLKRKGDDDMPDLAAATKMPKLKLKIKLAPSGGGEPKQPSPPAPAPPAPPPAATKTTVCQPLKLKIAPLRIQRDNLSPATADTSTISGPPPPPSAQASPPPKTPSPSRCGSAMDDYDFAPPPRGSIAPSDDVIKPATRPPTASPRISPVRSTPASSPAASSSAVSGGGDDQVWICPVCSVAYVDGACDMIGCDACNNWFHWNCVGLLVAPPDDQPWYCNSCARNTKLSGKKTPSAVGGRGRRKSSTPGKRGGGASRGGKKKP
uniref:PHD-type domain-containing protein n=1 Tax=Plectus sambesii TaxID=2011161 RepID=A0A914WMV8_9BILA